MPNLLSMALSDSILTLHLQGWSARRIARELGVNRETVGRHLKSKPANAPIGESECVPESKPANAPIGNSPSTDESKPANAPIGSSPTPTTSPTDTSRIGRASDCEPYRAVILTLLDQGLTAQRIHQDLVAEHGFIGSYHSVRRFVGRLRVKTPLPFRRMECGPGEEAQVDFGTGAPIVTPDGRKRRPHVFRVVLSHSRKGYCEVVFRQTTDAFVRCLENAFIHFGGVPKRIVLDNLRAAVSKADWFEPDLNPKVRSFADHYGTVFLPTKPRMPRHKGKIERGIGYVKGNALKGRTFASLAEQNEFLAEWERTVADVRIHGTTRKQVGQLFAEVERPALGSLPIDRFPCFNEGQRIVNRDGHVEIARAYYSAPPEYLGRTVWARWDGRVARLFNHRFEQIALHVHHESGRFSTLAQHIVDEKITGVERGAAWILRRIRPIGANAARWAETVVQTRGIEGVRTLQGLLSLAKRHPADRIDRCCDIALSHGATRLRVIRKLLARDEASHVRQTELPFMDEHPLIRPLGEYERFVHDSFQRGESS